MNNGVKLFLSFAMGAGIGVLASRSYFKTKYEKIADGEIESMKNHFEKQKTKEAVREHEVYIKDRLVDEKIESLKATSKSDIPEYGQAFKNSEFAKAPYIITPEEFCDDEIDFEKITLSYYAHDRILADDNNVMLDDVKEAVGTGWENSFGEFVEGAVYVRNEARSCDYEILYVPDSFTFESDE